MIDRKRFSLNRIVAPSLRLAEFYDLASSLGIGKVELRNDIGGKDPIDGLKPAEAARMAAERGIRVISINALQKFNLASARVKANEDLVDLIAMATAIGCPAIVLCPNNEADDSRSPAQRMLETVDALKAFGPAFEKAGLLGYIEPLGFSISSLASLVNAQEAIRKSGFACYKIVHDTFHHHIGPEDLTVLGKSYDVSFTGLVHVSGVEVDIPVEAYRDAHRILVGPADRMKNREQIVRLDSLGYKGDYSFEAFSPSIQALPEAELRAAIEKSLSFLCS
ncbi:MAG: TIM barrel protein [Rectinemataceae bacterium]